MKKTKTLIIALALCCAPITFTACKSPQLAATKVEGVVIVSVNTAMQAWADYCNAGNGTQAQIDKVKAAYQKYYDAQQVAKLALEAYVASQSPDKAAAWQEASASVASAEAAIIELVKGFLK